MIPSFFYMAFKSAGARHPTSFLPIPFTFPPRSVGRDKRRRGNKKAEYTGLLFEAKTADGEADSIIKDVHP
jgi:hypothetical protein